MFEVLLTVSPFADWGVMAKWSSCCTILVAVTSWVSISGKYKNLVCFESLDVAHFGAKVKGRLVVGFTFAARYGEGVRVFE